MEFSAQQNAFVDWADTGKGSCVLEAVAGAGKTTTLLAAARKMRGTIAILAYNKKIAEEIKAKVAGDNQITAGTVHSFGFGAYRKAFRNVKVDANKLRDLADKMIPNEKAQWRGAICKLVSMAKQRALGIIGSTSDDSAWYEIAEHFDIFQNGEGEKAPEEYIIACAKTLLLASNAITDKIDFDDMIYMPLLLNLSFWRYDVVMVDEAQDTNPARRALVRALVKSNGRVVAVGDRHQAIYGFTGADNDSLDLIAADFNAIRLPLTVTYRCPKAIVEFARSWVSHISAADTAPEGKVTDMTHADFLALGAAKLNSESAVLCRLTRPLVSLAFQLIRRRVPCKVEGRDIGASIKKLIQRWKVTTLDALEEKLEEYLDRETTKLLARKREDKVAVLEDTVETVRVIIDQCRTEGLRTVRDAADYVDKLFADDVTGVLTLSTIHKSKGREWKTVYWLDRAGTCPSKWARQDWQIDQETNLQYVAATRAMQTLVDLEGEPKKPR